MSERNACAASICLSRVFSRLPLRIKRFVSDDRSIRTSVAGKSNLLVEFAVACRPPACALHDLVELLGRRSNVEKIFGFKLARRGGLPYAICGGNGRGGIVV